mmetsp:Transcript_70780/g.178453  ORF Transcript_70780/g.178453 Transcript_70780/m.178453 type:complete len:209 (-) Transcript_70780:58-684(-)
MVAEHQNPAHISWQEKVAKERKFMEKHLTKTLKKQGAGGGKARQEDASGGGGQPALPQGMSRSQSTPAVGREKPTSFLPKISERSATPFVRGGEWLEDEDEDATAVPPSRRSMRTATSRRSASAACLPFAGDLLPGTPSCRGSRRGSMRSSLTGLTTASLRREVQEAVQQEVAKVVQPLQERLQTEKSTRQRLEEMLRQARGGQAGPT